MSEDVTFIVTTSRGRLTYPATRSNATDLVDRRQEDLLIHAPNLLEDLRRDAKHSIPVALQEEFGLTSWQAFLCWVFHPVAKFYDLPVEDLKGQYGQQYGWTLMQEAMATVPKTPVVDPEGVV